MLERDQIISFLLQACDTKSATIEGLQKQVAELQRQLAEQLSKASTGSKLAS